MLHGLSEFRVKKKTNIHLIAETEVYFQVDSISDLCEAEGKLSLKSDIISEL